MERRRLATSRRRPTPGRRRARSAGAPQPHGQYHPASGTIRLIREPPEEALAVGPCR